MANSLTRFNPFGDLARFDALRDFDDLFKNTMLGNLQANPATSGIRLDVVESEDAYTVKAEIPGAKKEDVKVSVDGNTVSIRVETKRDHEEKQGETVLRSERYYGVQTRTFSLAHELDDGKATARCEDGVLALHLPKRARGSGAKVLEIS